MTKYLIKYNEINFNKLFKFYFKNKRWNYKTNKE